MSERLKNQYYGEFWCDGKEDISLPCGPWHFEIPGKTPTREIAEELYKLYVDRLKAKCTDTHPIYRFQRIINEDELQAHIIKLRASNYHQPTIITLQDLDSFKPRKQPKTP